MNLNDLLRNHDIDPQAVIVLRHRPKEPELRKILPRLAAERPDVFNAYQQTQSKPLQNAMSRMIGKGYVASCIGHEPGKAVYVGLYEIGEATPLTYQQYWQKSQYVELSNYGILGFRKDDPRQHILWFDLQPIEFYSQWKGKVIFAWPPPEISWWRRAHKNEISVYSILEESLLNANMPPWDKLILSYDELSWLPATWKSTLSQWRGIYYIFDQSDGKGYVGSAYGGQNILGRWLDYATTGHGGNTLLRRRSPQNFKFSILQRVSPDMDQSEIVQLETSWKERLHTRRPDGLNDN
ncbi:MAG: GIY-YIG nuclease family protein [Anaerolineales bacterium]|nr:GIY-YIG nuclease family protein [Anaerolineales bacterium]